MSHPAPFPRTQSIARGCALLLLAALLFVPPAVFADAQAVPDVGALEIDGAPDDAGWAKALDLPCAPVLVPTPGADALRALTPEVKVAQSAGRLCVRVTAAEDPGPGMGLVLLVASEDAKTAADATTVAFRPMALRHFRYVVRGPGGADRTAVPAEGAAVWNQRGRWTAELAVGLDALRPATKGAPLRVAVQVHTRHPNLVTTAPAGARFQGPATWALLAPEGGAWATGQVFDTASHVREAKAEGLRMAAWIEFLEANADMGINPPLGGTEAQVRARLDKRLFTSLEEIRRLEPDLGAEIDTLRADVYRQLGLVDAAATHYAQALEAAPGWREARFGKAFHVDLFRWTNRPPTQGTDFAAAHAALAKVEVAGRPYQADARAAATGILQFKEGRLADAVKTLEPLAARYPMHRVLVMTLEQARKGLLPQAAEKNRRKLDARSSLPRVRLTTPRGPVVIELFQNEAPNAVNNFVWLTEQGFYDRVRIHQNTPFFLLQTGDPFSRDDSKPGLVGLGGPGYAIPARDTGRLPLRGSVVMIHTGSGTAGSQFALLTGTGVHAKSRTTVIGRVVSDLAVLDALVLGDRIERAEVVRKTPEWTYAPRTMAQETPEKPVATAPRAPGK